MEKTQAVFFRETYFSLIMFQASIYNGKIINRALIYLDLCQLNTLHVLLGNSMFPVGNRRVMHDLAKIQDCSVIVPSCNGLAVIHWLWHNWTVLQVFCTYLLRAAGGIHHPLLGGSQLHPSWEDWWVVRPLDLPGWWFSPRLLQVRTEEWMEWTGPSWGMEIHRWSLYLTPFRIFWAPQETSSVLRQALPFPSQYSGAGRYLPGVRRRPVISWWLQGPFLNVKICNWLTWGLGGQSNWDNSIELLNRAIQLFSRFYQCFQRSCDCCLLCISYMSYYIIWRFSSCTEFYLLLYEGGTLYVWFIALSPAVLYGAWSIKKCSINICSLDDDFSYLILYTRHIILCVAATQLFRGG